MTDAARNPAPAPNPGATPARTSNPAPAPAPAPGELTIGAFARATRLTPRALRRYDDLGLLRPARTDPYSGYRYYAPSQVEPARLVAWLRRIGMPGARIREVCGLYESDPPAAGRAVRAHWARVEAETAARGELALFLAAELEARPGTPPGGAPDSRSPRPGAVPLAIRHAAATERGPVRTANQDAVYAAGGLVAVADGYGSRGAPASAAAVRALRAPGTVDAPDAGQLLNALEDAVRRADAVVGTLTDDGTDDGTSTLTDDGTGTGTGDETGPGTGPSGTTLTAMALAGSYLALVHIGDTRAHLLRDGTLFRLTHDHTIVQSMIDEGGLTEEEAASHPARGLLLKALDGSTAAPDVRLREARPGDRWLLSSDGLAAVVPEDAVRTVLTGAPGPEEAVAALIDRALAGGAPDNVSCVVADVVPAARPA
ncbi:MerR family transcriptional regulator [Streptomyces sp. NPDC003691]